MARKTRQQQLDEQEMSYERHAAEAFVRRIARESALTLTEPEIAKLSDDAALANQEDGTSFSGWLDRIGGASNLYSYVECLA